MATLAMVDSKQMGDDAWKIALLVQYVEERKNSLGEKIIALHNSWQGEANSAFEAAISEDIAMIEELLQELANFADKMIEGSAMYVKYVNEISDNIGLSIPV